MANVLQNALSVALRKKPFAHELKPGSAALSEINSSLRHYAEDLRLLSFYETLRISNNLVVDKDSATMGYEHEEIAALNAYHRYVCKFETPNDSDYKTLRNALVPAIDMAKAGCAALNG